MKLLGERNWYLRARLARPLGHRPALGQLMAWVGLCLCSGGVRPGVGVVDGDDVAEDGCWCSDLR
jgi:hypothetical protein